jgi:integrase/recombinase XerD
MAIIPRRIHQPALSGSGERILARYEQQLCVEEDPAPATIRNYLSDLCHFATWYESLWKHGREEEPFFTPEAVATPTLTTYRTSFQQELHLKPNSVNRSLISLKRYFVGVVSTGHLKHDPAKVVKLVGEEMSSPRHLDDQEEQALVAVVTETGSVRDQAMITLLLHTGLRVQERCTLTRAQVQPGRRSGTVSVFGKRNTSREIPLHATARAALLASDQSLQKRSQDTTPLFLSEKKHERLSGCRSGYLIKKYAGRAHLQDVSPHGLRHCLGYRMAESVPLHRLAHIMGHDSLDTTRLSIQGTRHDLRQAVETIAWT